MIPMVPPGESALIQLLADFKYQVFIIKIVTISDFRFANTFYNWDTSGFITIMDDSVAKSMEDTIYTILANNASMSMFRLKWRQTQTQLQLNKIRQKCNLRTGVPELTEFLNELPVHSLGRKFLIIIRNSLVDNFLRVVFFYSRICLHINCVVSS